MTTCASRCRHLSMENAIPERYHFARCSSGHRETGSIRIRCLERLRLMGDYFAGRSGGTRAWRSSRIERRPALVDDSVNAAANIVGNIERPIRSDGQPGRTMLGPFRSFYSSGKTVCEDFATARGARTGERLEHYVIATLRVRRPIPRTVECNENTLAIACRESFLIVASHPVRSPMRRESSDGSDLGRTNPHALASVAAVFRGKHQFLPHGIVVAFGPAIISSGFQEHQLFSRLSGLLEGLVK